MENYKAVINYSNYKPLDLVETMNNTADGIGSDPIFTGSPTTPVALRAIAVKLQLNHAAEIGTGKATHKAFADSFQLAVDTMHTMGIWANYVCAGSSALLLKLKIPYYDASTTGRDKSTFSLIDGEVSGEAVITVPVEKTDDSYLAMYSLTADAKLETCIFAGADAVCKFTLKNLPVGIVIYVIWAAITTGGIVVWSKPYPIMVT